MNQTKLLRTEPARDLRRGGILLALAATLLLSGLAARADDQGRNQLQSITATKLAGDRVQLTFQLSAPAPQPLAFTVNQPARISLDLADTRLALKQRKTDVEAGMVNSVIAAEAGGRSRIVINLTSLVPYATHTDGNSLYVIVGANQGDTAVANAPVSSFGPQVTGAAAASVAAAPASAPASTPAAAAVVPAAAPVVAAVKPAPAAPAPAPARSQAAAPVAGPGDNQIVNVDFRRGPDGSGQVVVTLPNPTIVGNVHEQNGAIAVDFANAKLAEDMVRRMDVTDFATPVQYVDAQNTPNGSELVIHPTGQYEKLAYQSDDTFSVEFKPLSAVAAAQAAQKKQYTGQKISLNFQSIDLRAVLAILADSSGKNLVVSDSVNGSITLRLQDVPWDQALDIILKTKGLATRQYGNVMMVGTAGEISNEETAEAAAQQSLQQVEPLESAFIQVNYAKASDVELLVKGTGAAGSPGSLLTKRGSVSVDNRTNTLLVQDTSESVAKIREMVQRLDVAVKQVLIESRVVIANNDFTNQLGAQLGYSGSKLTSGSLVTTSGDLTATSSIVNNYVSSSNAALTAINSGATTIPLLTPFTVPDLADRLNVNLPTAGSAGSIAFSVLRGDSLIDLELSALQSEGQGEVVSSPRVLTADQQQAHIEQGVQIPYQQASSSGATTTAFKSAVLSLDVTPQITPDSRIIMDLEVHDDAVGVNVQSATGGAVPTIDTRDVKTKVLVNDGDTVVLGGIYETTETTSVSKVPLLGDIPLLGWLFRNTQNVNNKDELLVFVTPKIVDQTAATALGQ